MRSAILVASALLTPLFLCVQALAAPSRTIAPPLSHGHSGRPQAGYWSLSIVKDKFSGAVSCRLRSRGGKVIVRENAVGFRFKRHADVMHAAFRVDDRGVQSWRDVLPELARLRVPIDGRDMTAPTDGVVWLPVSMLEGAAIVRIQARPNTAPRTFSLAGFEEMRSRARALGCQA